MSDDAKKPGLDFSAIPTEELLNKYDSVLHQNNVEQMEYERIRKELYERIPAPLRKPLEDFEAENLPRRAYAQEVVAAMLEELKYRPIGKDVFESANLRMKFRQGNQRVLIGTYEGIIKSVRKNYGEIGAKIAVLLESIITRDKGWNNIDVKK